jgi:hypothetical protein
MRKIHNRIRTAGCRRCHLAVIAFTILEATGITGCQTCHIGHRIVIPSSDATDPSLTIDFRLPNGSVVTVAPGSATSTISVPGGGKVTVVAKVKDGEGVQDVQIWAASITWTTNPNTGTISQSGPGLLGGPTSSNRDSGSAGQHGCTERLVKQDLEVQKTPHRRVSYEVSARGVNFGGRVVSTPTVRLEAQ